VKPTSRTREHTASIWSWVAPCRIRMSIRDP
jgi:hypothetical protein